MPLCHGPIAAAGEDKEDCGGRGGILTARAAGLLQIAGDSITIRQRPAAAQAMRDQALRSVLQVIGMSADHTSTSKLTRVTADRWSVLSASAAAHCSLCTGLRQRNVAIITSSQIVFPEKPWISFSPTDPQAAGQEAAPAMDHKEDLSHVGLVVWQSAFLLAELLIRAPPFGAWGDVRVVDLGTGTGENPYHLLIVLFYFGFVPFGLPAGGAAGAVAAISRLGRRAGRGPGHRHRRNPLTTSPFPCCASFGVWVGCACHQPRHWLTTQEDHGQQKGKVSVTFLCLLVLLSRELSLVEVSVRFPINLTRLAPGHHCLF